METESRHYATGKAGRVTEDPQAIQFKREWGDLFLRVEILEPSLDDFRFMESVSTGYIQRKSGLTGKQWEWVQKKFRPVLARYRMGPATFQRRLGYVLAILKDRILQDYRSPADLKRERQKFQAARMRSARQAGAPVDQRTAVRRPMSAEARERVRQGAIRRWAREKAKEEKQ